MSAHVIFWNEHHSCLLVLLPIDETRKVEPSINLSFACRGLQFVCSLTLKRPSILDGSKRCRNSEKSCHHWEWGQPKTHTFLRETHGVWFVVKFLPLPENKRWAIVQLLPWTKAAFALQHIPAESFTWDGSAAPQEAGALKSWGFSLSLVVIGIETWCAIG